MKNSLYLTEADPEPFEKWFSKVYLTLNPEHKVRHRLCQTVTIVVTEDCNFACTYCYMHDKKPKTMSVETAHDVVDFLLCDEKTNGYISSELSQGIILDFIGGEPLLAIDLIDDFMTYFIFKVYELDHPWKDNYVINMSSNGSLYTTESVQRFVKKYSGRVQIGITIDGTKKLHDTCRIYKDGRGTYEDVIEAVMLRLQNGENPSTKVTIAHENLPYLAEASIHLFDLGYKFLNCNVVFEDSWKEGDTTILYLQLKALADYVLDRELYGLHLNTMFSESIGKVMPVDVNDNWCGGDGSMLAIGTDGTCYPCLRYMSFTFANKDRRPIVIGDVYKGIDDVEESEDIKCLYCITRRSQSTEECFNCPIASGCAWCSAFNYDCFGTPDKRTTYHCEMHKARVMANIYYWNQLYRKLGLEKRFAMNVPKGWALKIIDRQEYNMLIDLSKEEI